MPSTIERTSVPSHDPNDLIFIEGQAYDIRQWASRHPGGEVILKFLGKDASAAFAAFHGKSARQMLKAFRVKEAVEAPASSSAREPNAEQALTDLREQVSPLFQARPGFFVARAMFIGALVLGTVMMLLLSTTVWPLAAGMLALAWQQSGWLAHDILHGSTSQRSSFNHWNGLLLGPILQGYSCDWWKKKHDTHHALPNIAGVDPDIDVLPFLAFTEEDFKRASPLARLMIRLQPLTVIPIVSMARLNWVVQSMMWALRAPGVPHRAHEVLALLSHHAWTFGILALLPSWPLRIAFYLIAQMLSGLMTGAVFIVGHNARPMYAEGAEPTFHVHQIMTTQNVRTSWWNAWFFGGLDRQIEHHLFPKMPRHHHHLVKPQVEAICQRFQIPYVERGFLRGLVDVLLVLIRVALSKSSSIERDVGQDEMHVHEEQIKAS